MMVASTTCTENSRGHLQHWTTLVLDSERFLECHLVRGPAYQGLDPPPPKNKQIPSW